MFARAIFGGYTPKGPQYQQFHGSKRLKPTGPSRFDIAGAIQGTGTQASRFETGCAETTSAKEEERLTRHAQLHTVPESRLRGFSFENLG